MDFNLPFELTEFLKNLDRFIDQEIRHLIERNYERARSILTERMETLHAMADALMKFETIDKDQIDDIMSGKPPRPPEGWSDGTPGQGEVSSDEADAAPTEPRDSGIGGPASQH